MHEWDESLVVRLVSALINSAFKCNASDIHFEPGEEGTRVRFRIDGILQNQEMIDKDKMHQVAARLKILGGMDIAEKRIPQDGKFRLNNDDNFIDLRVSTFPSLHGENIVIRILDRSLHAINLDNLGFDQKTRTKFDALINYSQGFFLVAGPTGSGKTTTLYATLAQKNSDEVNIITLEDPVEYNLSGVTQGQIHPQAGFTFEKGMRSLLRQDPDIVMLGEIRDKETAQIGIEAALTGHLVFSTIHANDAPSVVMRLMDMGIKPFLINASLMGVLAQRLARKICTECRIETAPDHEEQLILHSLELSLQKIYKGTGCVACNYTGHKGRVGLFELLVVTNNLRSLIVKNPIFEDIVGQARADGMQTLFHDGLAKVEQGLIMLHELIRVTS